MQPRVTAILVARNGADFLEGTLAALQGQTRRPDSIVLVDAGSSDTTSTLLAAANPTQLVTVSARGGFGAGVAQAVHVAVPQDTDDLWIWLLNADNAPEPTALASLLAAVEIAPSVAIAGPKLMRSDSPHTIARYGESMSRYGASVLLVEDELDQAQYDNQSDLLGVAAAGMLVRRSVWGTLGGFDPGLPSVDAALDFSIRARLAGHRVIGVPAARVASAGGPELFGRRSLSPFAALRLRRRAQLHRRMVYSRGLMTLVNWLSLVPLALVRSIMQLIRKQPGAIGGEFGAAFATAFSGSVGPARSNLRRTRKLGWAAIAPLRVSASLARERRASRSATSDYESETDASARTRASFISGGGAGVVVLTAIIGVLAFSPLLGAATVAGGALLPLSSTVSELWSHVGYGWHDVGGGFVGASDPFSAVLAVLGSLTFWAPSFSIVLLYLAALPLAALGAWWCATRISERAWPPAIAALLWAFAPPFLSSMGSGHLGAVLVHILLPWLVLATILAARSWAAGAAAALLFAAVAASSPSIVPALVVMLLAWMVARPKAVIRLVGIVIPAAALFLPLVIAQIARGNPLAVFADPGSLTPTGSVSASQLLLGSPDSSLGGWSAMGDLFDLAALPGPLVLGILLVPLAILALASAFLPGLLRSIPSLLIALLGFVTAIVVINVSFATVGADSVTLWPGSALSLYWLGLVGATVVALDAFRRLAAIPALVVALASTLAAAPLLLAPLAGNSQISAGSGPLVPAYVDAEATQYPQMGTLVLTPQNNGGLSADLERGTGATLDGESTLATTQSGLSKAELSTATIAGNLASRSGLDTASALNAKHIGFVLLGNTAGSGNAADVRQRAADALDGNRALTPVGDTALGQLWRYTALPTSDLNGASPDGGALRLFIMLGLGLVFFVTILLAIPTTGRRRRSAVSSVPDTSATLGEDDDD
jgi:GT2 family glycosyltransferase